MQKWCEDRAMELGHANAPSAVFVAFIQHTLTLLADPNPPDVDAVLAHLEARRRAILRKEAGEVGK